MCVCVSVCVCVCVSCWLRHTRPWHAQITRRPFDADAMARVIALLPSVPSARFVCLRTGTEAKQTQSPTKRAAGNASPFQRALVWCGVARHRSQSQSTFVIYNANNNNSNNNRAGRHGGGGGGGGKGTAAFYPAVQERQQRPINTQRSSLTR